MDSLNQEVLTNQDIQIIEFLASGTSAVEVSTMLGVTKDYIAKKLEDPEIRKKIKMRGSELRTERVENKYAQTEEKILDRIKKYADDDFCEIPVLARTLETIAKNRVLYRNPAGLGSPNAGTGGTTVNVVTLMLPERAQNVKDVVLNQQGEIVAIGSRNMASMPIDGVRAIFQEIEDRTKPKDNPDPNYNPYEQEGETYEQSQPAPEEASVQA